MRVLVIDTSTGTSVAVVEDDRVVAERTVVETRSHAEVIGTLIAEVLEESGQDLDGVVAGLGPGPFTGLRVGIAAAFAFATGRHLPLYGVPSHDVGRLSPSAVTIITDARRKEHAWTAYSEGSPVAGPTLTPVDLVAETAPLATHPARFISTISAGELGRAAVARVARGDDLSDTTALYLRAPDATPSSGPKRVSQ